MISNKPDDLSLPTSQAHKIRREIRQIQCHLVHEQREYYKKLLAVTDDLRQSFKKDFGEVNNRLWDLYLQLKFVDPILYDQYGRPMSRSDLPKKNDSEEQEDI